jgi:hypothetical protein
LTPSNHGWRGQTDAGPKRAALEQSFWRTDKGCLNCQPHRASVEVVPPDDRLEYIKAMIDRANDD